MEKKEIETRKIWEKINTAEVIGIFCFLTFLVLAILVLQGRVFKIDELVYKGISLIISENVTPVIKGITMLGSATCFIVLVAICLCFVKDKKVKFSVLINLFFIAFLNYGLKTIIQRQRPTENRLIEEVGYSFPSGHAMVSMAFYGFLIYIIFTKIQNRYMKKILIFALAILILLIGGSRIYLGVHYPTDVLAGYLFSISYLVFYIRFIKKFALPESKEVAE